MCCAIELKNDALSFKDGIINIYIEQNTMELRKNYIFDKICIIFTIYLHVVGRQ